MFMRRITQYIDSVTLLSIEFVLTVLPLDCAVVFVLPDGKDNRDGFVFVMLFIAQNGANYSAAGSSTDGLSKRIQLPSGCQQIKP